MVRLADSDNPRLTFIDAQLTQLQLRTTVDAARQSIRDREFEEADRLISEARSVAGAESVEVNLLSQELSAARNQQQVEEILTTANERLEAGNLIAPNNDNARYYFERALAMEEGNQAAETGLTVVASKLVLQAREAIDNARLADAGNLLREARALDPASSDLAASTKALDTALEEIAEAERQAEAARLAELERQAEIERQAEAERLAELERQRELERQAEAARLEELRKQAELERQAEIERLARLEREAEEARLAEIERKAEEARQAELREIQRQESERQAAAAATASALGVAGSTVKDASSTPVPSFAAPRSSSSEPVQASNNTTRETVTPPPPASTQVQTSPAPAQQSSGSTAGATTYGMGDSSTVTFGETATQAAVPAGPTQTLATGNNVIETLNNARNSEPAADPTVAISTLTRTNYVAPVYPRAAQRRNVTGSVDVMFTVSTIGTVTDISVIDAEPGDTFNQAAMNAVAKWRFEPVIENGRAVEKRTAVRLAFNLQ